MLKYTQYQKDKVIELKSQGLTLKAIAEKVGINNLTTVHNICSDAGFERKPYPIKTEYCDGKRFYNFVIIRKVISKSTKTGGPLHCWECKCDCGKIFIITTKQIHRGQKSCGCLSISGRFHKLDSKQVIGTHRYNHYKNGASRRNFCWELTKEKFIELLFSNCHYCHSTPLTIIKINSHILMVNGVDRINSNIGYTEGNCVPCCKFCNRAKGDATLEEFKNWILKIKGTN